MSTGTELHNPLTGIVLNPMQESGTKGKTDIRTNQIDLQSWSSFIHSFIILEFYEFTRELLDYEKDLKQIMETKA